MKLFQLPWVTFCLSDGIVQSTMVRERDMLMRQANSYYFLSKYLNNDAKTVFKQEDITLYHNLIFPNKQRYFLNAEEGKWHKVGVEKNDFIVDCKIANYDCYDNFTLYMNSQFFNCYTLNYTSKPHIGIGPGSGLSVILAGQAFPFIFSYNVGSKTENSNSIKVVIHEKDTLPYPDADAIEALPGMSTSISMVQKKMQRIDTPKSKCNKRTFIKSGNTKVAKSLILCSNGCFISYLEDQCGCTVLSAEGRYGIQHQLTEIKNCLVVDIDNMTDTITRGLCFLKSMSIGQDYTVGCLRECIWNCDEIKYDYTLSYSKWPEQMVIPDFIEKYIAPKSDDTFYKMYNEKLGRVYNNVSSTEAKNEVSVAHSFEFLF